MKTIRIYTLLFAVMLIFSACSKSENRKNIITAFSADFTASNESFKAGGSITINRSGETKLNFTTPETINGLIIKNGGGQISIAIDDIISTADEAYLPSDNLPQLIHCTAAEISDGRETIYKKSEEFDTYILETSKGKCTYTVDKNGYIMSAEINSKKFRIDFYNSLALE